jgi:hypothetical protein
MANFATATDALTAALAIVDSRLTNISIDEQLELYLELINRRASIQQAIAASGGSGALQPPSTRTDSTVCLTTALSEFSIAMTEVKIYELDSRTSTQFRFSFVSGNTINTQNFATVRTGNQDIKVESTSQAQYFSALKACPLR